jgi:hypothetical protein
VKHPKAICLHADKHVRVNVVVVVVVHVLVDVVGFCLIIKKNKFIVTGNEEILTIPTVLT